MKYQNTANNGRYIRVSYNGNTYNQLIEPNQIVDIPDFWEIIALDNDVIKLNSNTNDSFRMISIAGSLIAIYMFMSE